MNIIETNLKFVGSMSNRSKTNRIILHHAEASTCSAEDIHRWHLNNGWSGAGYHFLVRKDGSVYRLRPEDKVGAHASGANSDSIGICFEGRYQEEDMPQAQKDAGRQLVSHLKSKYGIQKVQKHSDVSATSCPGSKFPFDYIAGGSTGTATVPTPAPSKPATSAKPSGYDADIAALQTACNAQGFSKQNVDGIPGPITLAGCPTVRQGARGEITRFIQKRLIKLGFSCGSAGADGIFGSGTLDAVRKFQASRGLSDDGIVGKNTWRALLGL